MKKELISIGIIACITASSLSGFAADISDFSDIPNNWAYDAVVYALNNGILKGDDNQVFPDRLLTRAELAAIINRSLGFSEKAEISAYADVSKDAWYYDDMATAVKANIFRGYDNRLTPESAVTREEVFTVIARAYNLNSTNGELPQFDDVESISDWAKDSVVALWEKEYINGDNNSIRPKDNITRAELAQILYNISKTPNHNEQVPETVAPTEQTAQSTVTPTATPTATPKVSSGGGGGGSSRSSFSLDSASTLNINGTVYYYAELPKTMNNYRFTLGGKTVTPTAVNAENTIVKYTSDVNLNTKRYAKTNLTYGEYWYTETSDGYTGELTTSFTKNATTKTIPDTYTAIQSGDDAYGATGADTDAGMYDAVSRATVGYGLGRLSFTQTVIAKTSSGETEQFKSDIIEENGSYKVVRPEDAKDKFGYDGTSNRGSNGEFKAVGFEDTVIAVSDDMAVNAEILKNIDGYKEQAQAVSDIISKLEFDSELNDGNVYDYKELCANGLYGKRNVNNSAKVKDIGSISEANTTENNTFTVNTKYGKRFGDVVFLIYFDDYKNMKEDTPDYSNINNDAAVEGRVGEFKNYVYNITKAKIEYLGEDGTSTPVIVGTKFGSDFWISPNHGPVVEVAVSKSYDRFKKLGNGKYRVTLMSDGYKDVVMETSASFDIEDPLKMQGDDDDVDEIIDGTDLVLKYDIVNQKYVDTLVAAGENNNITLTTGSGRNTVTVASIPKIAESDGVLTVTFADVKDKLTKDTQYAVNFPTFDYNDPDKLGMAASVHYAPAEEPENENYINSITSIVVDGSEVLSDTVFAKDVVNEDGSINLSNTSVFENAENDAYLVTITAEGFETKVELVGDTTLKNWKGNWENWQKFIFADESFNEKYPYLDKSWKLAYDAYIAAFEAAGMGEQMKKLYPNVEALKNYWNAMTYTVTDENSIPVAEILVSEKDKGYVLSWKDENGEIIAEDSYTMTGKMKNGLEGAIMYIFTADNLKGDSAFKYFVTMCPGMEGTEETPIASHYHFQFGSSLDNLLNNGELYNGTEKNIKNKTWYATMINEDESALAKYNVILGMHRADKWTELPTE